MNAIKRNKDIIILLFAVLILYSGSLFLLFPTLPSLPNDPGADFPGNFGSYPPARMDESGYISAIDDFIQGHLWIKGQPMHHFNSLVSFIASPIYLLFNRSSLAAYLVNVLISVISVLFCFLLIRMYCRLKTSLILTIIYALCTFVWYWSNTFFSEPLANLILTASFYFFILGKRTASNTKFFVCGLLVGVLLFAKTVFVLIGGFYLLFLLFSLKEPLYSTLKNNKAPYYFAFGFIPVFTLWCIRNQVYYGGLFTCEGSAVTGAFTFFDFEKYKEALLKVFIARNGIIALCPLFILFPLGLFLMVKKRLFSEVTILVFVLVYTLFIYSSFKDPTGQFGLGPRYYFPIYILLFFPICFVWKKKKFFKDVILGLATVSFFLAGTGWFTGLVNDQRKERELVLKTIEVNLQQLVYPGFIARDSSLFGAAFCNSKLKLLSEQEKEQLLYQIGVDINELDSFLQKRTIISLADGRAGLKICLESDKDVSGDWFLRLRKRMFELGEYRLVGVRQLTADEFSVYRVEGVDASQLLEMRIEPLYYTYNDAVKNTHIIYKYLAGQNSDRVQVGGNNLTFNLSREDLGWRDLEVYPGKKNDIFVILEMKNNVNYIGMIVD